MIIYDATVATEAKRVGLSGPSQQNDEQAVPFSLPGEGVRVRGRGDRAQLIEVITASPERVAPACPHFGACGPFRPAVRSESVRNTL